MQILCPRCGRRIQAPQTDLVTGALGLVFRRVMDHVHFSMKCEKCGRVPLSEFSNSERRWFYIESGLVVLVVIMLIGLVIFFAVAEKYMG